MGSCCIVVTECFVGFLFVVVEASYHLEIVLKIFCAQNIICILSQDHSTFTNKEGNFIGDFDVFNHGCAGMIASSIMKVVPVHRCEVNFS